MKGHHKSLFAIVFMMSLLISAHTLAGEEQCPKLDPVNVSALLLPPPCDSCDETSAELAELLALQRSRTSDQAQHAESDHRKTVRRFLEEIDIQFDDQLPVAGGLFKCIAETAEDEIHDAKEIFHRTRPYRLLHNELHYLKKLKDDDSFSYPSGHATYGAVVGLVLAGMLPEQRQKIVERIRDYGFSRMVAGVHFRSDVYAGEIAGAAIAASLFRNEAFRDAFDKARAEVRKSLGY